MIHWKLDKVLKEKGMTQKQLADLTGIRRASISYLCRDALNRLYFGHISEMCRVLDCQPGDLMEYVPDQEYLKMVKKKVLLEAEEKRKKAEEKRKKAEEKQFRLDLRRMKIQEDLENKKRLEERRKAIRIEKQNKKKLEEERKRQKVEKKKEQK